MGKLLFQRTEFPPGSEWALGNDHLLRFSLNGNFEFWHLRPRQLLWESGTKGDRLTMQGDGNLVIYDEEDPVWSSGTFGNPDAILSVDDRGFLEILTSDLETVLWTTEPEEDLPEDEVEVEKEPAEVGDEG